MVDYKHNKVIIYKRRSLIAGENYTDSKNDYFIAEKGKGIIRTGTSAKELAEEFFRHMEENKRTTIYYEFAVPEERLEGSAVIDEYSIHHETWTDLSEKEKREFKSNLELIILDSMKKKVK